MKRIDLFMPLASNYGVLHHFTHKMFDALQHRGINCRLLEAKRNDPAPFLDALFNDPPECTLSFNGLLPDDHGRFFCDMISVPHVACIVDSPNNFWPLTRSKYTIITCVDKTSVEFFHGLGFENAIFLPHAVERSIAPDVSAKRDYDVVMLASCIDYEGIRASWKTKFSPPLRQAMEEAAETALNDFTIPYHLAFVQALDRQVNLQSGIDPQKVDFISVLDEIEMFIRGRDRIELIKAIEDAKVDIFGSADGLTGWQKYLGHKRNVTIHDPVPFSQALEIMKQTKILLNSCPWINNGAHERIFAGLASGALVITNENKYLSEQFQDGKSIVFYHPNRWDKANHRINEYLANDTKRNQVVEQGQKIVMQAHTWDHRAAQLVKELPPILKKIIKQNQ